MVPDPGSRERSMKQGTARKLEGDSLTGHGHRIRSFTYGEKGLQSNLFGWDLLVTSAGTVAIHRLKKKKKWITIIITTLIHRNWFKMYYRLNYKSYRMSTFQLGERQSFCGWQKSTNMEERKLINQTSSRHNIDKMHKTIHILGYTIH